MSIIVTQEIKSESGGNKERTDPALWYVVKTKLREESICIEEFTRKGIPVFCPMTKEYRRRRRRTDTVPLFPGYIFCRFIYPDQYYDIIWARGVSKLVKFGVDDPPSVSESVVEFIRGRMDSEGIIDRTSEFKPGDPVRFKTGPFKDLIGTILKTDTVQERIVVLMELLYQAKVEVDSYQVETI